MRFDFIIGNPPYGTGANLAVKFLNKATEMSDDIRMVLPASFQRDSIRNQVNERFHLVEETKLPDDTFPRDITTVVQRWTRGEMPRSKVEINRTHPDFLFINYDRREDATLFIGGCGAGPAGKVKVDGFSHYKPGHHYVICNEEVKQRLIDLEPELIKHSRKCGCLPGVSKHDIIRIYVDAYGQEQT